MARKTEKERADKKEEGGKEPIKVKVVLGAEQLAKLLEEDEVRITNGEDRILIQLGDYEGDDLDDLGVAAQALATLIDDLEEDVGEEGEENSGDSSGELEEVDEDGLDETEEDSQ